VPLYRTGDVDALRDLPGVDWEAVRACRPGEPSPLRAFAPRPPARAQTIRRFVAQLSDRYGVEVWAWYHGGADRWEVDWEDSASGEPTVAQVAAAIAADPEVAQYRPDIVVATDGGAAVRWARAMLAPGAAVILDTVIRAAAVVSRHVHPNTAVSCLCVCVVCLAGAPAAGWPPLSVGSSPPSASSRRSEADRSPSASSIRTGSPCRATSSLAASARRSSSGSPVPEEKGAAMVTVVLPPQACPRPAGLWAPRLGGAASPPAEWCPRIGPRRPAR
jgi:hypothetical protein